MNLHSSPFIPCLQELFLKNLQVAGFFSVVFLFTSGWEELFVLALGEEDVGVSVSVIFVVSASVEDSGAVGFRIGVFSVGSFAIS